MASEELTLDNTEITVWADPEHPRKITGKVKVNGKGVTTSKTITSTATVEGKGKVKLTWVKPPAKKARKR